MWFWKRGSWWLNEKGVHLIPKQAPWVFKKIYFLRELTWLMWDSGLQLVMIIRSKHGTTDNFELLTFLIHAFPDLDVAKNLIEGPVRGSSPLSHQRPQNGWSPVSCIPLSASLIPLPPRQTKEDKFIPKKWKIKSQVFQIPWWVNKVVPINGLMSKKKKHVGTVWDDGSSLLNWGLQNGVEWLVVHSTTGKRSVEEWCPSKWRGYWSGAFR